MRGFINLDADTSLADNANPTRRHGALPVEQFDRIALHKPQNTARVVGFLGVEIDRPPAQIGCVEPMNGHGGYYYAFAAVNNPKLPRVMFR